MKRRDIRTSLLSAATLATTHLMKVWDASHNEERTTVLDLRALFKTYYDTVYDAIGTAAAALANANAYTDSELAEFANALGSMATKDDAPSDGTQYARKNGTWDPVADTGLTHSQAMALVYFGW